MAGEVLNITFDIEGEEAVRVGVSRMTKASKDLRWLWPYYRQAFYQVEHAVFAAEGIEPHWPGLSPTYAAWKAAAYPGRGILTRSGALRESLTSETPYGVYIPDAKSMVIGTSVPYAAYHQYGTSRMPARPPVQIPKRFSGRFARAANQATVELRKAWGPRSMMGS